MAAHFQHVPLHRWWRRSIVGRVDHAFVLEPIQKDSGWSPRHAFTPAWAALRRNARPLSVPGLPETTPEKPPLTERRALAIAALLRENGIEPKPAPAAGSRFALRAATADEDRP